MPVDTPHKEYEGAFPKWERSRNCFEGSDAVKEQGVKYLPKLDTHKRMSSGGEQQYDDYRMRALFFNATGRTVEGLAGALFQVPPVVTAPLALEPHMEDITLTGMSFDLFGLELVREVLLTGRFGLLIDMPTQEENTPAGFVDVNEIRPYWIPYRAEDIISWRTTRLEGREILTRVVLSETAEEIDPKDDFEVEYATQYRVLDLIEGIYSQTIWKRVEGKDNEFAAEEPIIPTRRGDPLPFIPFTFVGTSSTSSEVQKPPLLDLIDVNLSHYRTMADLEHGRHKVALPTPWVAGVSGGAKSGPLVIGSGVAWVLEKEGRAGMLEFTGQGLGALEKADAEKRKMMAVLGARLLEEQASTQETATAVTMRHAGEGASLRAIAQTAEYALTLGLRTHSWWIGSQTTPNEIRTIKCSLTRNFFASRMKPQELQTLIMALQSDTISMETFYANLQRGDIARPGVTLEEEKIDIVNRYEGQPLPGEGEGEPDAGEGEAVWSVEERDGKFIVVDADGNVGGSFATQEEASAKAVELNAERGGA